MMQMLEDTLIEHAHTKPLLPSQLIRYREVQVPDGKCWKVSFPHARHALSLYNLTAGRVQPSPTFQTLLANARVTYPVAVSAVSPPSKR